MPSISIPTEDQLKAGVKSFYDREHRFQAYFKALNHVHFNWADVNEMALGAKILLDSWHINFYRFGRFSLSALSDCISRNLEVVESYKIRNIISFSDSDETTVTSLFRDFLEALKGGKDNDCRSPVAVSKTIHLFAPNFFPLWDNPISLAYDVLWGSAYSGISQYIVFCEKLRPLIEAISDYECVKHPLPPRSALKILDEYNYSRFTKRWI